MKWRKRGRVATETTDKEREMTDTTFSGTAYCVKCKAKREMTNATIELSVKGNRTTRLAKSKCHVCGTTLSRILPKAAIA
jgi:hypothetical protein